MKTSTSLVLAPAVAAAIFGVIAVPAFASAASPNPSESSDSIELPDHIPTGGPATVQPTDGAQDSSAPETSAPDSTATTQAASEAAPEAILETDQVSQKDIADKNKGIRFSGTGFTEEGKATVTVVGTDGSYYTPPSEIGRAHV